MTSILINQPLTDFSVNAYHQGKFTQVTQQDAKGHWSIFFFYPADFSFVCPTELGDLADHYAEFQALSAEIYAVSEDSEFVHKAWAEATDTIAKVQYPMLADPAGHLARAFGVLDETSGWAYRATFIIDPDGNIQSYTINNTGIGRNAEEILRTLSAAQFVAENGDQVCPANWHPGQATITPSAELVGKI